MRNTVELIITQLVHWRIFRAPHTYEVYKLWSHISWTEIRW